MGFVVEIAKDGEPPRSVGISGDEALLGKHSGCEVVLADVTVSRRHARVELVDGRVFVQDLGSTNGTLLRGEPIVSRTAYASGDEIAIGPYRIRIETLPEEGDRTLTDGLVSPTKETMADVRVEPVDRAPQAARPPVPNVGFGPIEAFLGDETVTEIMVNGPTEVFVERQGGIELTGVVFPSAEALLELIHGIAEGVGRVIDDARPILDARLADGSRVNAVLMPLAVRGPYLTIRRFPSNRLSGEELVAREALSPAMLDFLRSAVSGRLNLLVSGGTGSGKTTLLNALGAFVGEGERIVTIEDAAELRLPQRHVLPLESRPPDALGHGQITIRDLVRTALRMRPDRIIVGEVRGGEALDMLQAMNTGHEGSLSTIHANSPREALSRLETLALFAASDLPPRAIREQIVGAVRLIVQVSRGSDGRRRVTSVTELTGMEGEQFTTGEIFGPTHRPTGYVPRCREKLRERGQPIDNAWFQP